MEDCSPVHGDFDNVSQGQIWVTTTSTEAVCFGRPWFVLCLPHMTSSSSSQIESLYNMMKAMQLEIRDLRKTQSSRGHLQCQGDLTHSPGQMQRALPCHTTDVSCR
eukprot:6482611-Amphidinium_carterae.2